jgi:ribosomal protein S18 acetylase RimI-like enzyme
MDFRLATEADVDAIAETILLAFLDDPVWGPALRRPDGSTEHIRRIWTVFVQGSINVGGQYLTEDAAAIASWTPPGEHELSKEQEDEVVEILNESLEPKSLDAILDLFARLDAAHPQDTPHAYLGFLATHPAHRGQGIAQQLLAENLKDLDARNVPAYLESTNPANNHRYARAGFQPLGTITSPIGNAQITTMWRDPR